MSKESEARIDRLERIVQAGLNIDLSEYDDPAQAKARAKQAESELESQRDELGDEAADRTEALDA